MENRRVLIAGCGYVGVALGRCLVDDGATPIGLKRDPTTLPPTMLGVGADLTDATTLGAIPEGITDVVITTSPSGGDDERYIAAYLKGPENLLAHLTERGDPVRRVLLTTSTGVYGQTDGSWVDEESPTEPTHHSGRRMLEAEALVAAHDFPSVAVRLGGIYGPRRRGLIDRVSRGEARTPSTTQWTNRIHREDCAGVLRHLLFAESVPAKVVGVDREPAGLEDVQRFLATELGVAAPPPETKAEVAVSGRRTRTNKRCASTLLVSLGYTFNYPTYREGYRDMLAAPTLRE